MIYIDFNPWTRKCRGCKGLRVLKFSYPTLRTFNCRKTSTIAAATAAMAAHVPIPTLKLNDGHSIPIVCSPRTKLPILSQSAKKHSQKQFGYGLGTTWAKRGDEGDLDRALVEAVKTAIGLGYKHLDGAECPPSNRSVE
jgi:hypothetical protein